VGTTDTVAILFTDLVGSTETVATLGEEEAERLRKAHFDLVRQAIADHGGTEVKNLGDGFMVAFAAASEAIAGAVAIQQAVERHNRRGRGAPLAVRAGVAVGEVTCEESDYFGTPVVEASRLCARAGGGRVLVTDMARALAGGRGGHRFDPLGPTELKGLPEPVMVYEVGWEALAEAAPPLPARLAVDRSRAFVGRSAERELIEHAWKDTEQGARRLVFLAGEPGIGKTRLATEIALYAHRRGGVVLLGTCDEDVAVPYQPFVEGLRHLVTVCPDEELAEGLAGRGGELTRLLPELTRRIPGLPPLQDADADAERYLLFSAVADLLATVCRRRPVLVILDDLHWATKPTLLLLKYLARSAEPMALLVIGTYRDSDIGRGHPLTELLAELRRDGGVDRLALRGLSDAEAVTLMESGAGHDLEGTELEMAHAVHAEADGNPFFMGELLRHLIETGELVRDRDRWTYHGDVGVGIPDSVREVIGHRVSRLGEPAERLLTLGAVIGREFDAGVLAAVAEMDRAVVVEALAEAQRAAVVREVKASPGRFDFVHALIRHTLYDELGPARRIEAHRAVAEALESLSTTADNVAELAYHWLAATPAVGVQPAEVTKAADYAERAGVEAMDSLAYEEAVLHFEGGLRAARQGADPMRVCELLIRLGEAQRCAGDPAHRETLLGAGRLAQDLGDAERAARAALANQRGFFSQILSVDRDKVTALQAALEMAGPTPSPIRARLLAGLAAELQFEDGEGRLELARQAVATARRLGDPGTLAHTIAVLWFVAWGLVPSAERAVLAAELEELTTAVGDRTLCFVAGIAQCISGSQMGNGERAERGLASSRRLAEELGQPTLRWWAAWVRGHRLTAAGRLDEATSHVEELRRLGEAAGQPDVFVVTQAVLLVIRILQGRAGEMVSLSEQVLERYPATRVAAGFPAPGHIFLATLAWGKAESGRREEAKEILVGIRGDGFATIPRHYLRIPILTFLSRACAPVEAVDLAAELHELLLPHRDEMAMAQGGWIGPVTHDLGLLATVLGRYDEAEQHFADAERFQERAATPASLVHTRLAWGRMLARRGRPGDASRARALLEAAKAGARRVNIPEIGNQIDRLLTELGVSTRRDDV